MAYNRDRAPKEDNAPEFIEKVVYLNRVSKTVKGGRAHIHVHLVFQTIVACRAASAFADEAGHQASRRMREQLEARYSVERLIPENKDWNDDLTLSDENAQGFAMNELR